MQILKKIVFKDQDQWDIQYFKRLHMIHCITSEGLDLQILSKCFMPYAKLCYCNLFNSLHIKMTGNSNVYDQHICHCICYFLHQLWIVFTSTELIFKAVIFNRKNFINTNPPARSNCLCCISPFKFLLQKNIQDHILNKHQLKADDYFS